MYIYIFKYDLIYRYAGKRDEAGRPTGEGVLVYENKDSFNGVFMDGILNR